MFDFIKKFFKKDEQLYPPHFAKIKVTDVARSKGIYDDHNKEVLRYKNGQLVERVPYTPEVVKAWEETYNIPIENEDITEDDEDYEFDSVTSFGDTKLRYK